MSRPSLDAGHNVSHRSVEGSIAVSLGRDAASTSTATADGQDPLSILRFFDVVLVVDDSGSMHVTEDSEDGRSRWDEARVALEGVAATVARYDSDGMDIAFLNSEAEGRGISSPAEVRKLFDSVEPNGQTPTGERLAMLFMEYWDILDSWSDKKKAGKLTADDAPPKKRNYIVLTDGRPSDDLASVIVQCARRLDEGVYPLSQLNVQFIQVGADVEATKALRELDSDLGETNEVRDIVDILAYSGGNLQAEDIMHQLHGGIFKRSKGIEEEAAYVRELVQDTPAAAAVVAKGILTEEEAATPEESAPVSEVTPVQEEDDEDEEEAETIPVTADGVPSSHPDAAKLNERLPQSDAAARAADEAGLGTALGAGLADLAPTARVEPEANNIVDAEPHQDEAENNTSEPDSEAAEARLQTAIFTQHGAHASEPGETPSSTVEAMEGTRTFSLLGKNLKLDTEEDAKPYCDELAAIDNLEEVHLGGNTLGQGACEAFAKALQSSRSTLRVFDGADIFTGRLITEIPASLKALCDGLVHHGKLEEVDLSDNAFGGRCADAMTDLFSNNHSIEVIRLQNNGLGISGGKIIAAALEAAADQLEAAGVTSRLRSVTIGRNRLENGSAPDLARALARHGKSIEEVRVPQNGIRMQGIEELCQQLAANCPNLRSLDLQDNTLVQRGSRALSAAIPSWPQLESLNLSDSIVRSTGAKWIFETLAEHSSDLHTLLLQYCELNRGALASLADALKALPNLKKVELHGNWAEEDDEFIERIRSTIEARGGSVEALGLDELELEAEEEEEPEEDYEDSEEEEEEEEQAEEEEEAEEETKEGGDVPVLTHDRQAVPAETQSPDQTEATEDADDGTIAGAAAAAVTALGAAVGAVSLEDDQKDDLEVSDRDVASAVAEDLQAEEAESAPASYADVVSASAPEPSSVPEPAPEPESSKSFTLLGKNLKLDTEEDAKPYCDELAAIDNLEEVHLGGNTLGQGACEAFAKALQSSRSTLRIFDGADIFTGRLITEIPASLKALCDGLVHHEKLEEVDLSDNAFGGRCADAMTELFSNNHSIEVIRLHNNGLGISGGKIIAAALEAAADQLEAAGVTSRLRSVTIGRNRLENGSAPDLARALARHGKSIEEVRVPQNGIRMQGIEELCQQLAANCPNLRSLDLQDNTLVQRGSRALSAAIPSWPQLESLNLSDSIVRSTGAKWIFETLAEHSSDLHTLLLQYCELNRGALASLADALEALPNLKKVELHGNWAEEDDEFIERIRSTTEARGGSVEALGLDELELEAEEEEEPGEDYEDSEEEEEEEAEEEEVADEESKEDGKILVLTHDRQVASAESEPPRQTEVEVPAPTSDETEEEQPQIFSPDTSAVEPSPEPEMNGAHEDVVEVETVEHPSRQSIARSSTNAEDDHAPVSKQSEEESLPDAKITEASPDVTSEDNRDIEASAQSTGGIAGVALGTVAALERAVNAVSLSDHSEDASTREAAAAPEELAHRDRDMQPVADAPTPSADGTSIEQPAEEDYQPSIESHSKAAVHHEADAEEPSEHPGLDATAAAVAVPAEIVDVSVQVASATGSVIQEKADEKVSEVAPNVALGLPLDEVATAAGASPTEAQIEPKREEVSSKPVTTILEQALEGAKSLIPDMSGGHIESSDSVSGEGFALGESVDDADADAKAETGTRGSPTVSRSGGIFNAIKSATGNVSLLSSRPRGGVSGEGLDSSALPTPAVEAPSSSGPQLSAATEGNGTGEGLPQSDSQTLSSKLQEALDDELPRRNGRGRHGRNSSIDLSGELYIDGDLSESRFEEHERQQGGPSLTNRFYAAFGAVLELMR
ncbi:unnamed protein product [Tilletia caries]|uniref:VWFA domain-containing protein n=7 Tax=Tilletia TaxID=13289 RepID=A0ABN7IYN1_9BASI|nr:unnamed protein product [Tilletia caries]